MILGWGGGKHDYWKLEKVYSIQRSHFFRESCTGDPAADLVLLQPNLRSLDSSMSNLINFNDSLTSKLNFICWNVQGWTNSNKGKIGRSVRPNDIRAKVIAVLQPDILAITETWLQGNESEWNDSMNGSSKLRDLASLMDSEEPSYSTEIRNREVRSLIAKLRGGTARQRIEEGRWLQIEREDRIYQNCNLIEVEDCAHFIFRCGKPSLRNVRAT